MSKRNPFLGARPYGLPQAEMFFGREVAARQLVERIDLYSLVTLTAPSGIGKTSLLRAAVMPRLERAGLSPVYLRPDPPRPDDDGAAALLGGRLAKALGDALLPDPALELHSLRLLPPAVSGGTLPDAKRWFAGLHPADELRKAILEPEGGVVERCSMIARYLNGTVVVEALAAQWRLISEDVALAIENDATIEQLKGLVRQPQLRKAARALHQRFARAARPARDNPDDIVPALEALISAPEFRISRPDGDADLSARVILIVDQFEQVFTLSASDTRDRLFSLLVQLTQARLPIHIVLSLRKEWYADLARQLERVSGLATPPRHEAYYLDSMSRAEARQVMIEVPRRAGQRAISALRQEELWKALQVDGEIDAVALSIACHELFEFGQERREGEAESAGEKAAESFDVERLLGSYLERALLSLRDSRDRDEAIDILGEVVGSGTTRDFITHKRLLEAPLRDPMRRARILDELQRLFLIRGDNPRRGSDKIYDIMHERLLEPVRGLAFSRPDVIAVRDAADRVGQANAVRYGLGWPDCRVILKAIDRLALDSRAAGIVLSALLEIDPNPTSTSPLNEFGGLCGDVEQRRWFETMLVRLATLAAAPAPADMGFASREAAEWWMTAEEFDAWARRQDGAPGWTLALESLLRSHPGEVTRGRILTLVERFPEDVK